MGLQSTKGTLPTTSFPWDLSFDASFPFNPFRKHLCHWSLQATFETSNFHINVQISSAQTLNLLCRVSACQIDVGDSEPQGKKMVFPNWGPRKSGLSNIRHAVGVLNEQQWFVWKLSGKDDMVVWTWLAKLLIPAGCGCPGLRGNLFGLPNLRLRPPNCSTRFLGKFN